MTAFENLRDAWEKRALYLKTKREIEMLPTDIALDIGLDPADAKSIARAAVYGA